MFTLRTGDSREERLSAPSAELGRISVFALTLGTRHNDALQGEKWSGQARVLDTSVRVSKGDRKQKTEMSLFSRRGKK
jgi:hypothetical protein